MMVHKYAMVLEGDETESGCNDMKYINWQAIQYLTEHPEVDHVPVIMITVEKNPVGTNARAKWCYNVIRKGKVFARTNGKETVRLNKKGTDFGTASYMYTWW